MGKNLSHSPVLPVSSSARAEIPKTSGSEAIKGDLRREGRGSWCRLEMSVCLGQSQEMEEGREDWWGWGSISLEMSVIHIKAF